MSRDRFTGAVITTSRPKASANQVTIALDPTTGTLSPGERVIVTTSMPDEELGRRVREEINFENTDRESIEDLADTIESAGYLGLAELLKEELL